MACAEADESKEGWHPRAVRPEWRPCTALHCFLRRIPFGPHVAIAGSFALHAYLNVYAPQAPTWTPNDVDVWCVRSTWAEFECLLDAAEPPASSSWKPVKGGTATFLDTKFRSGCRTVSFIHHTTSASIPALIQQFDLDVCRVVLRFDAIGTPVFDSVPPPIHTAIMSGVATQFRENSSIAVQSEARRQQFAARRTHKYAHRGFRVIPAEPDVAQIQDDFNLVYSSCKGYEGEICDLAHRRRSWWTVSLRDYQESNLHPPACPCRVVWPLLARKHRVTVRGCLPMRLDFASGACGTMLLMVALLQCNPPRAWPKGELETRENQGAAGVGGVGWIITKLCYAGAQQYARERRRGAARSIVGRTAPPLPDLVRLVVAYL